MHPYLSKPSFYCRNRKKITLNNAHLALLSYQTLVCLYKSYINIVAVAFFLVTILIRADHPSRLQGHLST